MYRKPRRGDIIENNIFAAAFVFLNEEKVNNAIRNLNLSPKLDDPFAVATTPAKKFTLKCQNDNDTFSLKYADVLV